MKGVGKDHKIFSIFTLANHVHFRLLNGVDRNTPWVHKALIERISSENQLKGLKTADVRECEVQASGLDGSPKDSSSLLSLYLSLSLFQR